MSGIPTSQSALDLSSTINQSGATDILHILSDNSIVGWIDSQGFGQGTLANSSSPPSPTTRGVVFSKAPTTHQFLTAINTDGTISAAQPTIADLTTGGILNVQKLNGIRMANLFATGGDGSQGNPWTSSSATGGIQEAINDTPSGGEVYLPLGFYSIVNTLSVTQPITIRGAGKGSVLAVSAAKANTDDVISINPTTDGNFIRLADFQIFPGSANAGRYAFNFNGASADILAMSIERVLVNQMGNLAANPNIVLFMQGSGAGQGVPVLCNIDHNEFVGGIVATNGGDTIRITNNQIAFAGKIDMSFLSGVSTCLLQGNNITVPGGIHIGTGAYGVQILHNEIETPVGFTGSNGAVIDIDGTSGSHASNTIVFGNSIQVLSANPTTADGIRLNYSDNAQVFGNLFERGAGSSHDITITSHATNSHIGTNEWGDSVASWAGRVNDSGTSTVVASMFNGQFYVTGSLIEATSHTPSSASDTGTQGQIAWDSSFIYICTATNTWKRVGISTW